MERSAMNQHDFPELLNITESIVAENPLQKKRIEAFFADRDDEYWQFAEDLSRTLNHHFLTTDQDRLEAARSYNKMCMDFLSEQIKFRKTGKYRINDSAVAVNEVYNDIEVMRYYMVTGLRSRTVFFTAVFRRRAQRDRIGQNRHRQPSAGFGGARLSRDEPDTQIAGGRL